MNLIGLLVAVLVICVVLWAIRMLLSAFGVGEPISTVIYVIIIIIALFWILQLVGVGGNFLRLH